MLRVKFSTLDRIFLKLVVVVVVVVVVIVVVVVTYSVAVVTNSPKQELTWLSG